MTSWYEIDVMERDSFDSSRKFDQHLSMLALFNLASINIFFSEKFIARLKFKNFPDLGGRISSIASVLILAHTNRMHASVKN